jgi:hypothetical protein
MDLRLQIHREDMLHSRLLESRIRPEMALKPSAAWDKRPVSERMQHASYLSLPSFFMISYAAYLLYARMLLTAVQGYVATSASLRGQQLSDLARGKRSQSGKIFTDSLTDKHDFDAPAPNTVRVAMLVCMYACMYAWMLRVWSALHTCFHAT